MLTEVALLMASFLTGQILRIPYIDKKDSKGKFVEFILAVIEFMLVLLAVVIWAVNTVPMFLVMVDWCAGYGKVFNVTYLLKVEMIDNKTNEIPAIALRDFHSLSDVQVIDNMSQFEIFTKLVIFFFAVSSCLSFNMFILALCCTYKCDYICLRKCTRPRDEKADQEDDDNEETDQEDDNNEETDQEDDDNEEAPKLELFYLTPDHDLCARCNKPKEQQRKQKETISTTLHFPESVYFFVLLAVNVGLWLVCVVLFAVWHYDKEEYYKNNLQIQADAIGFSVYMYSLFCTIVSCFIFSKLANSVSKRCSDLENVYSKRSVIKYYKKMIKKDDKFTNQAQAMLNWFEYWFTVHWVFYTVTSFLSIALFSDIFLRYIQADLNKPPNSAVGFSYEELLLTGLFTLSHCLLFLYPCFKAASVTLSRETMIKKVSKKLLYKKNTGTNEQVFIQYLKNKKYGFRISFFCARLRFSFNVAYISIFIGLLGVLTKLTGVL